MIRVGFIAIFFFLSGCIPQLVDPVNSSHKTTHYQSTVTLPFSTAKSFNQVSGTVVSTPQGDQLSFSVSFPQSEPEALKIQNLDFTQFKYVRIWVWGPGMTDKIWNNNSYQGFDANGLSLLNIVNVPKGVNRMVTAMGYDSNKNWIPGARLRAFYNSPPNGEKVKVSLEWKWVPLGDAFEMMLEGGSSSAKALDIATIQKKIEEVTGNGGNDGRTFNIHPSLLSPENLFAVLNKGQLPSPETLTPSVVTPQIVVQNPQGGALNHDVEIIIQDPASTTVTIPAGTDRKNTTAIAPGVWNAVAKIKGTTLITQFTVTIDKNGNVSLSKGALTNPIVPPPLITGLADNISAPAQSGVISWWDAEGNFQDKVGTNHGTGIGDTTFLAGKLGQGFSLDGVGDYIKVSPDSSLRPNRLSVALWAKSNTANWNNYGWLLDSATSAAGNGFIMHPWQGSKLMRAYFGINGGWQTTDFSPVDITVWHHYVATYDGNTMQMYVDGVAVGVPVNVAGNMTYGGTLQDMWIGGQNCCGGRFGNGMLDDVQIYNRALTLAEVQSLYNRSVVSRQVVLTGDGFDTTLANNTIKFGNTPGIVTAVTNTSLTATVPPGSYGNVPITVTTGNQNSNVFTYGVTPSIFYFTSSIESVGQSVKVIGSGFDPVNSVVKFNGIPATLAASTSEQLNVTVPVGATNGPITVTSANGIATQTPFTVGMRWKEVLPHLDGGDPPSPTQFLKRQAHISLVFNNKMWVIGGDVGQTYPNAGLNDVWSSADGVTWTQELAPAVPTATHFSHRDLSAGTVYNGRMWITGGYNRYLATYRLNDSWSSADGITWTQHLAHTCVPACGSPPNTGVSATRFGRRDQHSMLTFNNKIWVLGGHDDSANRYTDIWSSTDGITWNQEQANAPWGARSGLGAVVFNNKMWVIGGLTGADCCGVNKNDVWSSADGINWTQVTAAAPWSARSGHSVVVNNGRLYLLGGGGKNDVWSSADGVSWIQETIIPTIFSARGAHTSLVYNNKIWVIAGSGQKNDVWSSPE